MTPDCLIAGRDKFGRLPIHVGQDDEGCCVAFESFAYQKMGYHDAYELGPAEVVKITERGWETLLPAEKEMKVCAFLWTYYGYPNSNYEGVNVEVMRNRNGVSLAKTDREKGVAQDIDYVSAGARFRHPHAIGYANESGIPFARPFIKYTPTWPRSFMPTNQKERDRVAKMKQIPVHDLIEGKKLLFVDDSIVRGTQLRETVEFLYANGAKEVHIRSACPPIMYGCKFLNFSTSRSPMELLARRTVYELEGEEGDKHLEEYSDPNTDRGKNSGKPSVKSSILPLWSISPWTSSLRPSESDWSPARYVPTVGTERNKRDEYAIKIGQLRRSGRGHYRWLSGRGAHENPHRQDHDGGRPV